eukprot:COSAG04_NODE_3634_length_2656_cov_1.231521_4_plen_61_part_00
MTIKLIFCFLRNCPKTRSGHPDLSVQTPYLKGFGQGHSLKVEGLWYPFPDLVGSYEYWYW